MNKMNLPPPFGQITARPPMVTFLIHILSTVKWIHNLKCLQHGRRSRLKLRLEKSLEDSKYCFISLGKICMLVL